MFHIAKKPRSRTILVALGISICAVSPGFGADLSLDDLKDCLLGAWDMEVEFHGGYSEVSIQQSGGIIEYLVFGEDQKGKQVYPFLHVTGRDEKHPFNWNIRVVEPEERNQIQPPPYALLTLDYFDHPEFFIIEFRGEDTLYLVGLGEDPTLRGESVRAIPWLDAAVFRRIAPGDMISGDY